MKFYAHSKEGKPVDEWHLLEEHEGTVPDLRTERSGVVESGLSPAKRSAAQFAAEFSAGGGDIRLGCGMILGKMDK